MQVDFTIRVPLGVKFTVTNLKGDIQATSLTGDVNLSTVLGAITISTTGAGQVITRNGAINAVIGAVNWMGTRFFDTGNGNIDLQIPADANVIVRADAIQGSIVSEFALDIKTLGQEDLAVANGKLGEGG